jgi:hypothetical protein
MTETGPVTQRKDGAGHPSTTIRREASADHRELNEAAPGTPALFGRRHDRALLFDGPSEVGIGVLRARAGPLPACLVSSTNGSEPTSIGPINRSLTGLSRPIPDNAFRQAAPADPGDEFELAFKKIRQMRCSLSEWMKTRSPGAIHER